MNFNSFLQESLNCIDPAITDFKVGDEFYSKREIPDSLVCLLYSSVRSMNSFLGLGVNFDALVVAQNDDDFTLIEGDVVHDGYLSTALLLCVEAWAQMVAACPSKDGVLDISNPMGYFKPRVMGLESGETVNDRLFYGSIITATLVDAGIWSNEAGYRLAESVPVNEVVKQAELVAKP